MRTATQFFFNWLRFAFLGSWLGAFGWAAAVSAIILAWLPSTLSRVASFMPGWMISHLGPSTTLHTVIGGIGLAWVIALLLNAVSLAPIKAWRSIYPLSIKIAEKTQTPQMVQQTLQRHTVSVIVKNRSPVQSLQCNVVVSSIEGANSNRTPWSIHTSNVPRSDEHRVDVANWFYNDGRQSDDIRIFNEKQGPFAEASMLSFPQSGAEMCLSVRSPSLRDSTFWCRIRVQDRRLLIERIPAPRARPIA